MKKLRFSNSSLKFLMIILLMLLFLIPVELIKNLIHDRKSYQRDAVESITQPLGGQAGFEGIVVAVPYRQVRKETTAGGITRTETLIRYVLFAPQNYEVDFDVKPYFLTRGIFKVPVFNGKAHVRADFSGFDFSYFDIQESDVLWDEALVVLGLSNTKNVTSQPVVLLHGADGPGGADGTTSGNGNAEKLELSPVKYDAISPFTTGIYYSISGADFSAGLKTSCEIEFQGGEDIKIYPVGADNYFSMSSPWKSPSFTGGWLPAERNLDSNGFSAEWKIAGLSTVYPKSWLSETRFNPEAVYVSFIIPVDSYKKTERSVKYALLFLLIPFLALLISEVFSGKKIHPVQYCLIGLADVIFYLLLLSVSEHIPFDASYFICAVSVCIATCFYATAIFKSLKWGALVTSVQLVSYIFLYGTLQAEDYALLIGSIGLFVVIVLLMFITRKIDWYALNQDPEQPGIPKDDSQQ